MRLVDLLRKKDAEKSPSKKKVEEEKASGEEAGGEPEAKETPPRDAPEAPPPEPDPESDIDFGLFLDSDEPPSDNGASPEALLEEDDYSPTSLLTDAYLAKDLTEDVVFDADDTEVLEAKDIYIKTLAACRSVMEDIRADRPLNVKPLEAIAANLFAHGDPDKTIFLLAAEEPGEDFLASHCLNVALYSLKLGAGLGYPVDQLKELTMAGLLHDVGLLKIAPEIVEKDAELTGSESAEIRQHPKLGYDIVRQLGPKFERIAQVILSHHERVDGSGYPRGLNGDEIPEMSQVVGIAETYDTLVSERPYRKAIPPFDAVKIILEEDRGKYSPKMLKLFLTEISIFPINSLVRLNNHAVGRVVAINKNLPLRPVVEIIINPQGQHLAHRERLDLSRNPLIYIASSVSAEEVGVGKKS